MDEEMEICSNCKREIPSVNYVMHSVHCHRNIAVCGKCGEPVPRNELAEHVAEEHRDVTCECGDVLENSLLAKHKADKCKLRTKACTYCELEMPAKDLGEHENYCGSRTERCEECGEFVMLKYRSLHVDSNHGFIKLEDEPGPPPSWETPPKPALKRPTDRSGPIASALRNGNYSSSSTSHSSSTSTSTATTLGPKVANTVRFSDQVEIRKSSPVKRENHRPQVNTKQQIEEKSLSGPSSQVDEDLDRLLALRLAQEDMELLSGNQVSAILQGSKALPEAQGPPIRELREATFDWGATDVASNTTEQEGEVELPCEFCDSLVPASRLVLHQTGCRPDLARKFRNPYIKHFSKQAQTAPRNQSPPRNETIRINQSPPQIPRNHHSPLQNQSPPRNQPLRNHVSPNQPMRRQVSTNEPIKNESPTSGGLSLLHNDLASELPPQANVRRVRQEDVIPCDLCGTCMPASTFLQHQLACEIHHLPGRQADRPQALVMPLSGRSLKVRKPTPTLNYILPPGAVPVLPINDDGRNLLRSRGADKTSHKQALPGQHHDNSANSSSNGGGVHHSLTNAQASSSGAQVNVNGALPKSNGAVPKRKAKSSKKYHAPPPPPQQ